MSEKMPQIIDLPPEDADTYRTNQEWTEDQRQEYNSSWQETRAWLEEKVAKNAATKVKRNDRAYDITTDTYLKNPTPSRHMSRESLRRDRREGIAFDDREQYDTLEAREAAEAAKPFMDVATDVYDTYKRIDTYDYMEDVVKETNLGSLVGYAERRARDAVESKTVPELTHVEKSVIEAFQTEKELLRSEQAIWESDVELDSDGLKQAINIAYDRSRLAKDRREAFKWEDMSKKLRRYSEYLSGDAPDDREAYEEFKPNTSDASLLLGVGAERGVLPNEFQHVSVAGVRNETRNMQRLTEMNNFLAELYPKKREQPLSDDEIAAARAQLFGE